MEVVWQRPPTSTPRGTLFLAHGCNHAATDFFPRSERCRHCVGLPEETSLVDKALKRGYAVVAVSSVGRCWSGATDGPRVKSALDALFAKNTNAPLVGKPVFAFGASSGGAFVGILPFITSVDGIIAQISSVRLPKLSDKSSLTQELRAQGGRGDFPPVVFSRMSRDELTGKLVDSAKTYLKGMEVPVRVTVLKPLPIHEKFFSERVRGQGRQGGEVSPAEGAAEDAVNAETSAAMARALRRAELVDESGYLKEDPRASEWREVLAPMARTDSLQPDKSALSEVLNVAYALHELSADGFDEDVAWLEAKAAAAKAARLGLGGDAAAAAAAAAAAGGKTDKAGVVVTPPRRAAAEAEAAA